MAQRLCRRHHQQQHQQGLQRGGCPGQARVRVDGLADSNKFSCRAVPCRAVLCCAVLCRAVQGEEGSLIKIVDTIRVKPACQLASDVLASAQRFQRISPAFPENSVSLVPRFCFSAALKTAEPQQQCFTDALHMQHFSMLAALRDPDKGSQYHGYVMYHDNVTRVCQATISPKCVADTNGDEELCMAMLVTSAGIPGQPSKSAFGQGGGYSWTPGAAAAVAVAGGWLPASGEAAREALSSWALAAGRWQQSRRPMWTCVACASSGGFGR
jgi:hypothetical protein